MMAIHSLIGGSLFFDASVVSGDNSCVVSLDGFSLSVFDA